MVKQSLLSSQDILIQSLEQTQENFTLQVYSLSFYLLFLGTNMYGQLGAGAVAYSTINGYFKTDRPLELYVPGRKLNFATTNGAGGCIWGNSCYNYAPALFVVTDGCSYTAPTISLPSSPILCGSGSRLYGFGVNDYSQLGGENSFDRINILR
jgi:hypothetical protein